MAVDVSSLNQNTHSDISNPVNPNNSIEKSRKAAYPQSNDAPRTNITGNALRFIIVIAAMIGSVLEVLDVSITNVAIPQMQGNLGATLSQIAWVNTGYIISNVIILPLTGWLAARFGQRAYFATSVAVFTVASLMCGASHSLGSLIFWRVIQGLGGGGLLSTGQVIMLQAFPKEMQGVATAIFGVGVMIGPSLGPVLGGYLTDNFSWPFIFYVNLPFGIAAAILTWFFVPDGARHEKLGQASVDWFGVILLAVGMGSLQTVLEKGQEEDWFSSRLIINLTVTAVIGLVTFIWWELKAEHPIVDLRIMKNRSLTGGMLFNFVLGVGLYATIFLLPVFLQTVRGYTAYETGMSLLPSALISMVSFMVVGGLSQKVDNRILIMIGVAFIAVGCFGLSQMTSESGVDDVFWGLMGRGASLGFLFIPLTVASLTSLRPEEMGTGSGLVNLSRQLGGSIGIAGFSTLLVERLHQHRANLTANLYPGSTTVRAWLQGAQQTLQDRGMNFNDAHNAAVGQMDAVVQIQAYVLSFNDAFVLIGAAFVIALPLLFLFKSGISSSESVAAVH